MKEIVKGQTPVGLSFLRTRSLIDQGTRVIHRWEVPLEPVWRLPFVFPSGQRLPNCRKPMGPCCYLCVWTLVFLRLWNAEKAASRADSVNKDYGACSILHSLLWGLTSLNQRIINKDSGVAVSYIGWCLNLRFSNPAQDQKIHTQRLAIPFSGRLWFKSDFLAFRQRNEISLWFLVMVSLQVLIHYFLICNFSSLSYTMKNRFLKILVWERTFFFSSYCFSKSFPGVVFPPK